MKKSRWKEPSTWAGLAAIFGSLAGVTVAVPHAAAILTGMAGVCGGVAVMLREGKAGAE